MATVSIWSGVNVAIQSALAATKTLTAITKASPGVASSVAHGYSNGDWVVLEVLGMSQVNGRVFRVSAVSADLFTLEGEDTTLFDTFSSGTAQKITYGTTMTTAIGLNATGGEFDFIDTTTIHDTAKTQIPGASSPASYSFEHIWDVSDAALVAMKAASDQKAKRAVRLTYANGQKVVFTGYVGMTLLPVGSAQDLVKTPGVITMNGKPTTYTT